MITDASAKSVLVTGASRGIGLGLVRQLLLRKGVARVFAGVRNPETATDLAAIDDPRLTILQLDVLNDDSIKAAVAKIDESVGPAGLDILINNAAVLVPYYMNDAPNRAAIDKVLSTNVTSQIIVTHYFLPLLQRSHEAAIVSMGSDFGSLTQCSVYGSGGQGYLVHKVSKAALNQFCHVLSEDFEAGKIVIVNLHPGWVATEMGTVNAPIMTDDSCEALVATIAKLDKSFHGGLFNRFGKPMPF